MGWIYMCKKSKIFFIFLKTGLNVVIQIFWCIIIDSLIYINICIIKCFILHKSCRNGYKFRNENSWSKVI